MMKKILTFVLTLAAITSILPSLYAQSSGEDPSSEGIHLAKTIESFDYDTFVGRIKMESFVEGEVKIITEKQPQDIVLVLDVSTSMNDNLIVYSARSSQSYSYNSYGSSSYYYLHSDGNYYQVRRGGSSNSRRLSFNAGGTTYYLTGTSIATSDNRRIGNSDTIWTGVLYTRSQTSNTKLSALQNAAISFINNVYDDAVNASVSHRISIVTFAETASTKIGLTEVTSGRSSMISIINNLSTANWTSSDRGMSNAATVLNAVTDTTRGKDVVMFTDGVPCRSQGSGNTFEVSVANGAISNSLTLKQSGAKVYTVGVFDSPSDQTHKYMNFVSSNYPDATDMNYSPYNGTPSSDSYYMTATNSEELNNIFTSIAQSISGGASISLDETTVLKDVFTSFCSIHAGASGVSLKLAPCTGRYNDSGVETYSWGGEIDAPDSISFKISTNDDGESYVDITGFDYSANWCGLTTSSSGSTPHGYKLIAYIDFKLTVTPELQDVYPIYSNSSESGLYKNDGGRVSGGEFENPIIAFGRIIIKKYGLQVGHSAIFKVTKGTEPIFDIILTGTGNGSEASAIIPLLKPNDTYTVTENTDWSWAYTISDESRSQSKTFDENGGTVTFTFNNDWNEYQLNSEKSSKSTLSNDGTE